MPSAYDKIREDNILEYGQGTRHLSFLGRLYTDRTHFVFELLQNAEDAGASRILFRLFNDRLEVTHDGRPFNELDVRGVCGVGEGTKADDLTQIGKFGIGFKSVYAYTSKPEVHSGAESFRIESYVRPYPVEPRRTGDSWTTLFVFAFDAVGIDPETACREISARLRNLSARTLLFLRKINEIEYKLPDLTDGVYLREEVVRGPARQVTVIGQNNGLDEDEDWLVFERPVPVPDGSYQVLVEIGFQLKTSTKNEAEIISGMKDVPLVVYFPTEKPTRFSFLIQGPYRTTPSRDNIPKEDDWNKTLVQETAHLLTDALPKLKDLGLISVSLLEALPVRINDFPKDSMFYPIVDAVRNALINEDLLPADDGTFVSAQNAKLSRGADLRKLLNQDQLYQLFQSKNMIKWLVGEITQDRTPDLRTYLLNELHIEEVTPDSFARKITQSFLANQGDNWFVDFYEYLSGQEGLWRPSRWAGDAAGLLRSKPILRLQDNSQVVPFRSDGVTLNAFLPPPEETDFPIVKRTIANHGKVKDFLERLKLKEPDVFDDIVRQVLPKYTGPDMSSISSSEHVSDIQKILRALKADSEAGKRKVTQAASRTPFLKAVDQNGKVSFKKPVDIYFPTQELLDYFLGNPDVWFLDEIEGGEEWCEIGVENKPRFMKIRIALPWDEKIRLMGNQGHTRDIETTDYTLDGIENFLLRFSEGKNQFDIYSLILWNFLLQHLKKSSHYRFYEGEYKWFYYQERSVIFDATWKKQLYNNAWLPKDGDDVPHLPSELRLVDLPDSFNRDEKLANLLGMKEDVVAILAEEAGVKADDIELMRQHPEEFQRWKDAIVARNNKSIFPTRPVSNPERRREALVEELTEAPEKEYKLRTRSVRVTEATSYTRKWLNEQYRNDDTDEMFCQICQKEMPFKKHNGEYYFEAIEALSRDYFTKEHEAQFLALCPVCAAMYKEFITSEKLQKELLKELLLNSEELEIPLQLGELSTSIRFVETHREDLRTIIQKYSEKDD
ncbi:MAG: hypothetical protein NT010_12425 [Proteobacteria bacterium]|nr:hypothetical protein [Pseudomonadota bacterium]